VFNKFQKDKFYWSLLNHHWTGKK